MNSMSLRTGLLLGLVLLVGGWVLMQSQKPSLQPLGQSTITIAITQIVEHAALDEERAGMLSALKSAGYQESEQVKIVYQNAQGNMVTATQIAQQFLSLNPTVMVAISTPSAQALLSIRGAQTIPLVFSAVTDPIGARLVKDLIHPGMNISGVSDYVPVEPQLQLVKNWIPTLKKLGIIYNAGEANSVSFYEELQKKASLFQIQLVPANASRTSEVSSAAQSLVGHVDAIYVPTDNTAVAAMESIVQVGIQNQLPVFAGDTGSVLKGAIATQGYNRFELGKAAGEKIVAFLKAGQPIELPISTQHVLEMTVNRSSAAKMGLSIPVKLPAVVKWVGEQK